jgi:hypothetical protein
VAEVIADKLDPYPLLIESGRTRMAESVEVAVLGESGTTRPFLDASHLNTEQIEPPAFSQIETAKPAKHEPLWR